jgi:hypothetical protein
MGADLEKVNVASAWVIRPTKSPQNSYEMSGVTVDDFPGWGEWHWVIRSGTMFMDHDGKWLPRSGNMKVGAFVECCAWATLEEALTFACKQLGQPSPMVEMA